MRALLALVLAGLLGCERNADPGFRPSVVPDQHCGDDGALALADDGCNHCVCRSNVWTCGGERCRDVCQPGATKQVACSACRCTPERVWDCDRSTCLGRAGPR